MADLPRRDELFRRFRAGVLAVANTRISAKALDTEGADANLIAAAASLMGDEIVSRMSRALAGCFESSAVDAALDRLIMDRKSFPRKPSSPAVGFIQLTRPTAAAGAGTIDGGPLGGLITPTPIKTSSNIDYVLLSNAVFGAADLGPITVPVQSLLSGRQFQVDAGQQWTFGQTVFDNTIIVNNVEGMAGASDLELDADYRSRSQLFFASLRRGTLEAIRFGALSVPGVTSVSVIEATNPDGNPACMVEVFVLDPTGRANARFAALVQNALLGFRPAGIPVIAKEASVDYITIRFRGVSFDASVVQDTAQATEDIRSAIVAVLNNQAPGQSLVTNTITSAVRLVPGVLLPDYVSTDNPPQGLIEPVGTQFPPNSSIALRTRRELISFT